MTRSFAVALVFLEVRVIGGIFRLDDVPGAIETIVWSCVAFSLLFADIVLQWQEIRRTRPVARKVQNATPAVAASSAD
jgi:hypothetical protein